MSTPSRRQLLQAGALGAAAATLPALPALAAVPVPEAPLRFRLGIVTYNIAANWDLDTLLRTLKAVGIGTVECRTTHRHGVEPTLTKDQRREVKSKFADAGIEFWGCGTVCEFQSTDPAEVKRQIETCKQFVQLAADLGGKGVKVRPNGLPKESEPLEKTLQRIGQALVPCGEAAADAGVEIWVEVHGKVTCEPRNIKAVMEACGHKRVGLTWNSNPEDVQGGSVAESFRLLRPWVRSCHINELYKDAAGRYPYRELFRLLRESGYDRVTLCEVGRGMPDAESGAELLRYYKALWTELCRG